MPFKLNSTIIKNPNAFDISLFTITKATRLLNGDMTMSFIANKRKFTLSYNAIQSSQLNPIIDILWTNLATTGCFVAFTYMEDNVEKTATVYAGEIPKKLHRGEGNWVWKDVSFSLIER